MDRRFKYIGWYQIAGGIIGVCLAIWLILTYETLVNYQVLIILIAITFYSFSVYCGSLLIKEDRVELGVKFTTVNQILQIFYISMFGLTYQYYSGIQLSFGLDLTADLLFKFDFSFSGFSFTYGSKEGEIIVMFNIIPVLVLRYLDKIKNNQTSMTKEVEIDG